LKGIRDKGVQETQRRIRARIRIKEGAPHNGLPYVFKNYILSSEITIQN